MQTWSIRVDDIEIGERHRALSDYAVERLAGSMRDIGLKQPISVRIADGVVVDGQACDGVPLLVVGRHRLAAAKRLGWSHIDCIDVEGDEIAAELWEIAENLHRLDLTKEQRDEHIRRYDELLTARSEAAKVVLQNAKQPAANPKGGRPVSNATKIAQETGLSYATVHRALNPQPVQPKPVRSDQDVILAQANAIVAAWNRACPEARDMALAQIDGPVFDQARAA